MTFERKLVEQSFLPALTFPHHPSHPTPALENSTRKAEIERGPLGPQMQYADQREQAPAGVVIDRGFAGELLDQAAPTLVVQRPAAGVDRLDLAQIVPAQCVVIALADDEIVFDDAAKRPEADLDRLARARGRR